MDGTITIKTELDTKTFDKQIEEVEYQLKQLDYELEHAKELNLDNRTVKEYETQVEKLTNKLVGLRQSQAKLQENHSFDGISKSLTDIIKKVAKWSLAVIGVRSAYLGIRQAINTISQYDQTLAQNIQYIQFALANTLKPVIEWIVNAMYQIIIAFGRIVYLISGINIFKNSGISDFQKSLKKSSASVKEIKKQIAGFDEMNVLSESNTGASGGGSEITAPDFSKAIEQESKLELIAKNLIDKWITIGDEMGKALNNPKIFTETYGKWGKFVEGITRIFYGLYNVINGLVQIVGGVMDIIVGIFTGDFEKIKSGFKSFVDGIADVFDGVLNIIKGVFQTIIGFVVGLWDKVKNTLKTFGAKVGEVIGNAFKTTFNGIMKVIETFLNAPIKAINKLVDVINKVPGINLGKLTEFKLPRLARGGIVNNPGKGVMMGSYIAGERGSEAVIPLDDTTMDRLGEAIARHMQITNDNKIYMNARQIARQMNITNAEHQFAYNS